MIRVRTLLVSVLLAVLTGVVFGRVAGFDFVAYDDDVYVYENLHVRSGISFEGLRWAFTTTRSGHWHPLTWLSHMLDCELFGLNPGAHHLSSLCLHLLNVLLLFGILYRMTGALWRSAFAAALFAIHPLHVEPVVWVSSRKDLLSTLFLLLTLWAYLRYTERGGLRFYLICLGCFGAGLLAKSMIVTVPALLVLLDAWPLKRLPQPPGLKRGGGARPSLRGWVLEKVPFLLLAGAAGVAAVAASRGLGEAAALPSSDLLLQPERVSRGLSNLLTYLQRTFWPHPLSVAYPEPATLPAWKPLSSAALLLAVSAAVLRLRKGAWAFGWFWFLVTLLPVSGLLFAGTLVSADRYTYVPLMGLFILITWAGAWSAERLSSPRALAGALMAGVLLALGAVAHHALEPWRASEPFFRNTLRVAPGHAEIRSNLGHLLVRQGRHEEAVEQLRAALRAKPYLVQAHNNLGLTLTRLGRVEEAIAHLEEALAADPGSAEIRNNMGIALAYAGRHAEAEALYRSALRLRPGYAEVYNNLGNALAEQGRPSEAEEAFREALAVSPDSFEAHKNLGRLLLAGGRTEEGTAHLWEALRLGPEAADTHFLLAGVLARTGEKREAAVHYRRVIRLEPRHAPAFFELGSLLAMQGHTGEALHSYRRAVALRPGHAPSRFGLGLALACEGRLDEARGEAVILDRLDPGLARVLGREITKAIRDRARPPGRPRAQ